MKALYKIIATVFIVVSSFNSAAVTTAYDTIAEESVKDTFYYRADAGVNYDKPIGYFIKDGVSEYRIVIPENATKNEEYAANIIKNYFQDMTEYRLQIVGDGSETFSTDNKVLSVGKTIYKKNVDLSDVDYDDLSTGGFITKSFGNVFVIDSSSKNGLIYAAYNFLEIFFGLEFLTENYTYVPHVATAVAYETDITDIPYFPFRDYYATMSLYKGVDLGARFRMNSNTYHPDPDVFDGNMYYTYSCDYNGSKFYSASMGHTIIMWLAADAY
ncbi:MAG TPA: hypothetical protein DDW54_01500, partial [Clostridiales bacterium]|nr:hypothetical protein [Clostridiales bacterium]